MSVFGPLVFGLDPSGQLLNDWGLGDTAQGLERFVDISLEACVGTVGLVKPQSAFYERHGWRGIRSLARLVASCRREGLLVLLDVKRGDIGSTNEAYAEAYLGPGAPLRADAITVTPYLGLGAMEPILGRAITSDSGVFVVTRSSNPEGRKLQESLHPGGKTVEEQLLEEIARENAKAAPGGLGPIGAVFAPTHGAPKGFDLRDSNGLYLAPGVGAQGATPADVASCFAGCRDRVLAAASRVLLAPGPDVASLRDSVQRLSSELGEALAG